jgi:C-terminal processing protease CtpA/Prc
MNAKRLLDSLLAICLIGSAGCISRQAFVEAHSRMAMESTLRSLYPELKRSYYDPQFKGLDVDKLYAEATQEVKAATSEQERRRAIIKFLDAFDDSHTFFVGGTNVGLDDFGFSFRFYGDKPVVSAVNTWAPADSAGLRRGDEIVQFDGQKLNRENYIRIVTNFLGQHPIAHLNLQVRAPDRSMSDLSLRADTAALRKLSGKEFRKLYAAAMDSARNAERHIQSSIQKRYFFWKVPSFNNVDLGLGKAVDRANDHETLILDLRGNPGGAIANLEKLVGYFIEKPVDVGTLQMRWDKEQFKAKPKGDRFRGKMFILVDSETGSAAEVFARLMQLDKRAVIVGDRTAGAVMASMYFPHAAASITVSDFVLHNGERLEKVGVTPDVVVIPSAAQVASGEDPALAHALGLAGVRITPSQAARIITNSP